MFFLVQAVSTSLEHQNVIRIHMLWFQVFICYQK
jgi:hypothetical protein